MNIIFNFNETLLAFFYILFLRDDDDEPESGIYIYRYIYMQVQGYYGWKCPPEIVHIFIQKFRSDFAKALKQFLQFFVVLLLGEWHNFYAFASNVHTII